jgi:acetyltransferase-like isoleucine patch superfamily enzyme
MNLFKRKIHRVFFYAFKLIIGILVYFDSRLYMKFYLRLLRSVGLKTTGTPRFIAKSVKFDDFSLITLGDRVVLSMNVHLLTHDYSFTTALISVGEYPSTDIGILGPITIGNNVFVGMNSIILPGAEIGSNVIIGAGSVVRGKIPDNSVLAGNPASIIGEIKDHAEKLKARNYTQWIDLK